MDRLNDYRKKTTKKINKKLAYIYMYINYFKVTT